MKSTTSLSDNNTPICPQDIEETKGPINPQDMIGSKCPFETDVSTGKYSVTYGKHIKFNQHYLDNPLDKKYHNETVTLACDLLVLKK